MLSGTLIPVGTIIGEETDLEKDGLLAPSVKQV